ncbi:hypothetical protein FSP39_008137 [Pinctada imbricata]|uniref:Uncharacterized protein n=1 Tax=Pinctada imbricata TaxID=66713 RepID=A0AA89CDV4_PINIB|nr:hypothetical protein FSP39_008137 [Pinctada imbricata]
MPSKSNKSTNSENLSLSVNTSTLGGFHDALKQINCRLNPFDELTTEMSDIKADIWEQEAERLHDVEVTVAGPNKEFNMICGTFEGPGTASQIVVIECPHGMKGRYVKLQIVEGTGNILTLCEVKVIGN